MMCMLLSLLNIIVTGLKAIIIICCMQSSGGFQISLSAVSLILYACFIQSFLLFFSIKNAVCSR
jgi:hypothetical protein